MQTQSFAEPQKGRLTALAQASYGDFSHLESITTAANFRALREHLDLISASQSKENRALFGIYDLLCQDEQILDFIVNG